MRIFKRATPEVKSEMSPQMDDQLLRAFIAGTEMTRERAMQIPSFAGCVNKISDKVAGIPIKLYENKNGIIKEIENDRRTFLLNKETGDTLDGNQFKKAMVKDYLIGKGGYAYLNKKDGMIESIHYVSEEKVSFNENVSAIFKDYYILVDGNTYYPHEFIKFLRSTTNGYKGKSLIEENGQVLSVAYNSLKFEENLVATGGNKKGFIKSAKHLSQAAIDNLKKAWAKLYSNSTENIVILNEGLDFKESSNTSVEMQLNENKKTNGEEICKIMGTPAQMLSGGASANDDKNFIKYEITNVLSDFETAINKSLLLEVEKDHLFFKFDIEELIKGDIDQRYSAYAIGLDKGFLQIDEVRKKENIEPLGMTFVKLGLEDGLYDPVTKKVYVLNTDKMVDLNKLSKKGGNPSEN